MCMSSTSSGTNNTTTNTSNTLDPAQYNLGTRVSNMSSSFLKNNPYQGYTGETQGSFGPTWNAATTDASGRVGSTNDNYTGAQSALGTGTNVAAQTATTPIANLMSQYTQAALNPTIDAIQRQAGTANQGTAQGATMSGAFGDTGYGTQKALNDYNTTQAISGATGQAYNQAYQNAYGMQQSALQNLFSGASGSTNLGTAETGQQNTLDQLLAGMGSTQQQANQTGINTAINVNNQNQMGQLQQLALAAGAGNTAPHSTFSYSNQQGQNTQTQPDNSGIGMVGSLLGGFL